MFENIWTAIKTHPWVAGIGGAVIVGGLLYAVLHKSSSSSSTPAQDLLVNPSSGPVPLVNDGSSSGGGGGVGSIPPIPGIPTTPTPPDTAPFTNGGGITINPYVGPTTFVPPLVTPNVPPVVTSAAIPFTSFPGQPVNTVPAGSPTVTVPVGSTGLSAIIPYTGDTPSPAIQSALGDTVAINAGMPASGQTGAQALALRTTAAQTVAGINTGGPLPVSTSVAPTGLGTQATPPPPVIAPAPDYAGAAAIAAQQRALANQISTQVAANPPAPAPPLPKTVTLTSAGGSKTTVSTAPAAGHRGITGPA